MKHLVINADDFGSSRARDRGILESIARGVVTSVSLLVNGAAADEEIPRDVGAGLHFNLVEGRPLTGGRTLANGEGFFYPKHEARRRAKQGLYDRREVEAEATAQIEAMRRLAGAITHIDGHQHLHVYPGLPEPVARAARAAKIAWIRAPGEERVPDDLPLDRQAQIEEYRALSHHAREVFEAYGLRSAAFFGSSLTGRMTPETFEATIRELPEGVSEIMVHPGYAGDGPFDDENREHELRVLTSPEAREALAREGITLTHFGKV